MKKLFIFIAAVILLCISQNSIAQYYSYLQPYFYRPQYNYTSPYTSYLLRYASMINRYSGGAYGTNSFGSPIGLYGYMGTDISSLICGHGFYTGY